MDIVIVLYLELKDTLLMHQGELDLWKGEM